MGVYLASMYLGGMFHFLAPFESDQGILDVKQKDPRPVRTGQACPEEQFAEQGNSPRGIVLTS